jgi:hypothetical protein
MDLLWSGIRNCERVLRRHRVFDPGWVRSMNRRPPHLISLKSSKSGCRCQPYARRCREMGRKCGCAYVRIQQSDVEWQVSNNRLTELQVQRNNSGRAHWEPATAHRERVTREILDAAAGSEGRLCVLGAGNCIELDLDRLNEHFSEIHLVDIDSDALEAAWARQFDERPTGLHLHGGVDVTGVWQRLKDWSPQTPPSDEAVEDMLRKAAAVDLPGVPRNFTVVVSVCMLSQLIESVVLSLGERHPRFLECVQAIRRTHLKLIVRLTEAGGSGLLISDFVSSVTAPQLSEVDDAQLPGLVMQLINSHNFFTGLNPVVLKASLQNEPDLAHSISRCELTGPWRWPVGPRVFAVVAVRFRRHRSV